MFNLANASKSFNYAKYYKKIVNLNSNKKQQSINSASQSFDEAWFGL